MANSSIHIQGGSGGSVTHNSRETFSYSVVFKDENNELWNDSKDAFKIYRDELNIRSQAYTERTGQKLQKNALTQLSAVVNLEQHHTLKDLESIKKHLEKTFDTKVFQMSIHRDEGKLVNKQDENIKLVSGEDFFLNAKDNKLYFDKQFKKEIDMKEWNIEKNYHAHIEMMGIDSKGNGIKRNYMNIRTLSNIQTFVAKELDMQRGNQSVIINENGELERDFSNRKKRQDTHPFKESKKIENDAYLKASKELLATKEQLKEANNQLRTFMKDNGAVRTDYAELEKAKKELEEKLKSKTLTEKELLEKFQKLEETFKITLTQKDKFLGNLQEIGKEVATIIPIKELKEIPGAVKTVLEQNKSLQAQKEVLASKVTTLEEKIVSSSNMTPSAPPKEIAEEFKKIKKEEIEEKEVKVGLFKSETAPVIKSPESFFTRTWNLVNEKYNELRNKYNDLVSKFKDLKEENTVLKEKVASLELDLLVEKSEKESIREERNQAQKEISLEKREARKGDKSDSSTIQIEKKDTQSELRKMSERKKENDKSFAMKKMEEMQRKIQEEKREEITPKKKSYSRSR
jgi:hypothetical protein